MRRNAPRGGGERRVNHGQRNAVARHRLVNTAPHFRKKLGTFTSGGSLGGNTRIKLFNVGLLTGIDLRITIAYTNATADLTRSAKGPHAAISRIKLVDFDGSDRINCSGYHLFLRNSMRYRSPYLLNNGACGPQFADPSVPVAQAANTATFSVHVPVCANFDKGDLRGMMLMQTAVGEVYLSIDWAGALHTNGNDDFVFNGAATSAITAVSFSVDAWQEYYLPQAEGGRVQLPTKDLLTVYELAGMVRSTTDFAANTEKLVNLPNVREVLGGIHSYRRNSVFPTTAANDMILHRIIANGNNVIREDSDITRYQEQRQMLNGDLAPYPAATMAASNLGTYLFDWKRQPYRTWLYGNIQQGFTPASAPTGTTDLETTWESIYQKGTVLPGLGQS